MSEYKQKYWAEPVYVDGHREGECVAWTVSEGLLGYGGTKLFTYKNRHVAENVAMALNVGSSAEGTTED